MSSWLTRAKEGVSRLFKTSKTPSSGSQEFTPEPSQDHALVLSVTEPERVPRLRQLRFFGRILSATERRMFWAAWAILIAGLAVGGWGLAEPHLISIPAEGGIFREGLIGSPKLINPLFAPLNDVDRDLTTLIYSGLFRIDEHLDVQPDLAESYRWLDQEKTLEIKLREGARFHDGLPVTSGDVEFTYQSIKNPNWRSPLASTMSGAKLVRVDDQTIQFQLEKPSNAFLYQLTVGILPAHVWQEVPDEGATIAEANLKPVGSGPYKLEAFTKDSRGSIITYRLKRFDDYYGIRPYITEREFRFYGDRSQAEEGLRANQIDALAFIPWTEVSSLKSTNITPVSIELPQTTTAFFNVKNSLLKDERLRQALSLALDRQELAEISGDHNLPATGPFPFLNTTTTIPGNIDEARRLLEASNWKLLNNESVRRLVTGKTTSTAASSTILTLTIDVPDQPDLVKIAEYLKRRWSLMGAQVDVEVSDPSSLLRSAVTDRDYQIFLTNILLSPNQDLSPFWESSNVAARKLNFSNIADRDIDKALDNIRAASSTQALQTAQNQLHTTILNKHLAAFLVRPTYAYVISKRVKGMDTVRISRPSDRLTAGLQWYVDTSWRWK